MTSEAIDLVDEARRVAEATAYLLEHAIPEQTREFRLRQEFFRHGWDVRVRDQSGYWAVYATKPGLPGIEETGSTEGSALRLALSAAIKTGESEPPS